MIRDLISKLGGPVAAATIISPELSGNAVNAWAVRNKVPWRWRARLKQIARRKRIPLTEDELAALDVMPLDQEMEEARND